MWMASFNDADGFDELIGRQPDGEDVEDMSAVQVEHEMAVWDQYKYTTKVHE